MVFFLLSSSLACQQTEEKEGEVSSSSSPERPFITVDWAFMTPRWKPSDFSYSAALDRCDDPSGRETAQHPSYFFFLLLRTGDGLHVRAGARLLRASNARLCTPSSPGRNHPACLYACTFHQQMQQARQQQKQEEGIGFPCVVALYCCVL